VDRQVGRDENPDLDLGAVVIRHQGRIAQVRRPAARDEPPPDPAQDPPARETGEVMMVRATGREGSIGRQAMIEGDVRLLP